MPNTSVQQAESIETITAQALAILVNRKEVIELSNTKQADNNRNKPSANLEQVSKELLPLLYKYILSLDKFKSLR